MTKIKKEEERKRKDGKEIKVKKMRRKRMEVLLITFCTENTLV